MSFPKKGKLISNLPTIPFFSGPSLVFGRGFGPSKLCPNSSFSEWQIRLTRKSELQLGIAPKSGAWHPKVLQKTPKQVVDGTVQWVGYIRLFHIWKMKMFGTKYGSTPQINNGYVNICNFFSFFSWLNAGIQIDHRLC